MKLNRIVLIINSVILIGMAVVLFMHVSKTDKAGFVDIGTLYNGFDMTVQYKAKLDAEKQQVENVLDSLNGEYQLLAARTNRDAAANKQMEDLKGKILKLQDAFANRMQVVTEDYNNKILQQLNQYVREYGEQNGYSFIFGAAGTGSLMYGDAQVDITEKVVAFANNRFQGEPLNE